MKKEIFNKLIEKAKKQSSIISEKIEKSNIKEIAKETKINVLNSLDAKVDLLKKSIKDLKETEKKVEKNKTIHNEVKKKNTYYEEELVYKNDKNQQNEVENRNYNNKIDRTKEVNEVVSTENYKEDLNVSKQIELAKMKNKAMSEKKLRKSERHKKWAQAKIRVIVIICIIVVLYIIIKIFLKDDRSAYNLKNTMYNINKETDIVATSNTYNSNDIIYNVNKETNAITSQNINIRLFDFTIPSYWKENNSKQNSYKGNASVDGVDAELRISSLEDKDLVSFDLLKRETLNGNMQKVYTQKGWYENAKFVDYSEIMTDYIDGFVYNYKCQYEDKEKVLKVLCFPSIEDNRWYYLALEETMDISFSYFTDFDKIIKTIKRNNVVYTKE